MIKALLLAGMAFGAQKSRKVWPFALGYAVLSLILDLFILAAAEEHLRWGAVLIVALIRFVAGYVYCWIADRFHESIGAWILLLIAAVPIAMFL